MLDLSKETPPLDLRERIERYKAENSFHTFSEKQYLIISGILRKNSPLKNYIKENNEEGNLFETPLIQLMCDLTQGVSTLFPGLYFAYTASNRFILVYHPKYTPFPINRDNLTSLVCSRAVNLANRYYKSPMCLVSAFQVPSVEVQNILAYYKMSWIAKRNRLLGQLVLGIKADDTTLSHEEVLNAVKKNGYSLSNLNKTLREGFYFSPHL